MKGAIVALALSCVVAVSGTNVPANRRTTGGKLHKPESPSSHVLAYHHRSIDSPKHLSSSQNRLAQLKYIP
jgi:hypothetical protein